MGTTRSLVIHIRGRKPDLNRVGTCRVCYDCVMHCRNIVLLIVESNLLIPVGKILHSYAFVVVENSRKFGTAYHELSSVFSAYVAVCLYLLLLLSFVFSCTLLNFRA